MTCVTVKLALLVNYNSFLPFTCLRGQTFSMNLFALILVQRKVKTPFYGRYQLRLLVRLLLYVNNLRYFDRPT